MTMINQDLKKVNFFLIDLDGTFYLGSRLFPWSLPFMNALRGKGKKHLFLTNNSSASRHYYAEKITRMGYETTDSEVFTSTTATIIFLKKHHPKATLYVLGTPAMQNELRQAGLIIVPENPDIVLLGFDNTLTYEKLKNACYWLRAGKYYIATHPDINCPMPEGPIPDTGAMIEMIAASTGRRPDVIIGKPNPPIIEAMFERYPYARAEVAMIGDRLYTDIQTGINAGIISILVLSGETTREMYQSWTGKADFVFNNIGEIIAYL